MTQSAILLSTLAALIGLPIGYGIAFALDPRRIAYQVVMQFRMVGDVLKKSDALADEAVKLWLKKL